MYDCDNVVVLHLHVFNCDVDSQADATQHDTQCYSGQYRHHDTWQRLDRSSKQYDRIDAVIANMMQNTQSTFHGQSTCFTGRCV